MSAPARSKSPSSCRHNSAIGPVAVVLYLLVLGLGMFGAWTYFKYHAEWQRYQALQNFFGELSKNKAEAAGPVVQANSEQSQNGSDNGLDYVCNPPFKPDALDSQQRTNFDLVQDIPNRPEFYHLDQLGLPSFGLTESEKNWFLCLALTEASLRQFDTDTGEVIVSDAGCDGLFQGCDYNICPKALWDQLYTNIWCGAKAFKEQLRIWNGTFVYAIAGYKGAWLYATDSQGEFSLDEDGNRIIVKDDAGNPRINPKKQAQVDSVTDNITSFVRR